MQRNQLSDMTIFVEVARTNGFRAAAQSLKLKPGSVSDAVQRFENRLGVRLFERSTRTVNLTAIGERLYKKSLPAINDLEAAIDELDDLRDTVSGKLKLSAPYSSGTFFLDDLVSKFAILYPETTVDLIFDDNKVDLVSSGVDAVIRSNTLLESDTHAVPVGPKLDMAIVASPGYLDKHGTPETPEDILNHYGICFAFNKGDMLAPWIFGSKQETYQVMPKPRIIANDLRSLVKYAQDGLGLAYVYREVVEQHFQDKSLIEVLATQVPTLPSYSLNYRSKKNMTLRLRAFIDLAKSFKY